MAKNRFTEKDLKAMGLVQNSNGAFVKGNPDKPMFCEVVKKSENILPSAIISNEIFIAGEVMSSKNSRRNFGHTSLLSIPATKYKKDTAHSWVTWKDAFLKMCIGKEKPYKVQFRFVRKTKRICDFHNMVQILCDLMVDHQWIDDDNMNEMVPVPPLNGPIYTISKTNPGVYISVI